MKKVSYIIVSIIIAVGLYGSIYLIRVHQTDVIRHREVALNKNIALNASNAAITVKRTNKKSILVTEKSNVDYDTQKLENNEDTVTFQQGQTHLKSWHHLFPTNLEITVEIPKQYDKNLKIVSESGEISLASVHANHLLVHTLSGAVSGSLSVDSFEVTAQSGEVNLKVSQLHRSSELTTTSGEVNLNLQNNPIGKLNTHSNSGDISVEHGVKQHTTSAYPSIKITTTSGAIKVK